MGSPVPTEQELKLFFEIYTSTNNFTEASYAINKSAWEMEAYFNADPKAKVLLEEARHKLRGFAKNKLWEAVQKGRIEAIKLALKELDPEHYGSTQQVTVHHKIEIDDKTKEALRALPKKQVKPIPPPQRSEVVDSEVVEDE